MKSEHSGGDSNQLWDAFYQNSPYTAKYDKPEREIIAFSIGFKLVNESRMKPEFESTLTYSLQCLLPPLVLCSVISNILLIRGMYCLSQWRYPPCIYITILSMLDLLLITIKAIDILVQVLLPNIQLLTYLVLSSHALCSTYAATQSLFNHLRSCLLCIHTALLTPHPSTMWCDSTSPSGSQLRTDRPRIFSSLRHLLLLLLAVLLIINSHFLWTYSLLHVTQPTYPVPPGNYCTCLVRWVSPTFRDLVWPFTDIVIRYVAPLVTAIIAFLLLLYVYFRKCRQYKLKQYQEKHLIDPNAYRQLYAFSVAYTAVSVVLLLLPGLTSDLLALSRYHNLHKTIAAAAAGIRIGPEPPPPFTTFPVTYMSVRTYSNRRDLSITNIIRIFLQILFPTVVLSLALCTTHAFLPKFLVYTRLASRLHNQKKLNNAKTGQYPLRYSI